jgi:hypothetical protein
MGGIGRRIAVQDHLSKNVRSYLKNKEKKWTGKGSSSGKALV